MDILYYGTNNANTSQRQAAFLIYLSRFQKTFFLRIIFLLMSELAILQSLLILHLHNIPKVPSYSAITQLHFFKNSPSVLPPKVDSPRIEIGRQLSRLQQIKQFQKEKMLTENKTLSDLLMKISQGFPYKETILEAKKTYKLNLNLEALTVELVIALLNKYGNKNVIVEECQDKDSQLSSDSQFGWGLWQYKVFAWLSVCYAGLEKKQIHHFNSNDIKFMNSIFPNKSHDFLQYHINSLTFSQTGARSKWTQQEIDILLGIVTQKFNLSNKSNESNLRWSQIAFELYLKSNKMIFKLPQKCRQLWMNHLDPSVNRNDWSTEEDYKLFLSVTKYGLKWAFISKQFNRSRTEHMIKNRYKSLINKYKKKYQGKFNKRCIDLWVDFIQKDLKKKLTTISLRKQAVKVDSQSNQQSHSATEPSLEFQHNSGKTQSKVNQTMDEQIWQYLNNVDLQLNTQINIPNMPQFIFFNDNEIFSFPVRRKDSMEEMDIWCAL